eukprot:g3559.t1
MKVDSSQRRSEKKRARRPLQNISLNVASPIILKGKAKTFQRSRSKSRFGQGSSQKNSNSSRKVCEVHKSTPKHSFLVDNERLAVENALLKKEMSKLKLSYVEMEFSKAMADAEIAVLRQQAVDKQEQTASTTTYSTPSNGEGNNHAKLTPLSMNKTGDSELCVRELSAMLKNTDESINAILKVKSPLEEIYNDRAANTPRNRTPLINTVSKFLIHNDSDLCITPILQQSIGCGDEVGSEEEGEEVENDLEKLLPVGGNGKNESTTVNRNQFLTERDEALTRELSNILATPSSCIESWFSARSIYPDAGNTPASTNKSKEVNTDNITDGVNHDTPIASQKVSTTYNNDDKCDTGYSEQDILYMKDKCEVFRLIEEGMFVEICQQIDEMQTKYPEYFSIDMIDDVSESANGDTILIRAALHGRKKVIKYCLRNGANIDALNWGERGVIDACRYTENEELENYFLRKGLKQ